MINEELNYQFLLLTHLVCADQQIHSEELKALHGLADQIKVRQSTIEEMEKILAQDETHLSIEDLAYRVLPAQRSETMQQIVSLARADGFFAPLERKMVEQVARIWNWSGAEIEQILERAEGFNDTRPSDENKDPEKLSFAARLLKGANSLLSRELLDRIPDIAPKNIGRWIEKGQREILLAGPEYDGAIRQCAAIASEDYKFSEIALESSEKALRDLGNNLQEVITEIKNNSNGRSETSAAKEVVEQLEATKTSLTTEIIRKIENVRKSLYSKQRAINHFSIAFMGKTTVGKSTLHAIITGEGWSSIGVGKQRTTRFNRVYEWKNMRIIDTPGIGAAEEGGRTDEEIALSIIDESDIVCYMVANNNIQETEFAFLKHLKEKNKPLIILLNVKNNLRDSRRLISFLKNPNKLFSMEGRSGLGGHINRIRRYAQQHYANDYFEIIPVMLLAAQLAREPEHEQYKEQLFKASQIQEFLDSIRVSLIENGAIRRSQTLLGSTVGSIEKPNKWVTQQAQEYQKLIKTLKDKHKELRKQIKIVKKDSQELLQQKMKAAFQDALDIVPSFAEDNWNSDKAKIKRNWEQKINEIKLQEKLKVAIKSASEKLEDEIQNALEEVGRELQLIDELNRDNSFVFTKQDIDTFFRNLLKIGQVIMRVAAGIVAVFAPPVALIIGVTSIVVGWVSGLFKSKKQKRKEAVQNIKSSLTKQLNEQKQKTLKETVDAFDGQCDSIAKEINIYFDDLIVGLEAIVKPLEDTRNKLDDATNYLNYAYAKRIIDWCSNEQSETLTEENIDEAIGQVTRDFGRRMDIHTKLELPFRKSQNEIKLVLQEDIVIQTNQSF